MAKTIPAVLLVLDLKMLVSVDIAVQSSSRVDLCDAFGDGTVIVLLPALTLSLSTRHGESSHFPSCIMVEYNQIFSINV